MSDLPTILFVNLPPQLGGSNRSLLTLLRSLEGRVNRVVASPSFGSFIDLVRIEGLADEYVTFPRRPKSKIDRLLRFVAAIRLAWWTLLNRTRVGAIHANALTALNMCVVSGLIVHGRTVVWIHDPVGSPWGPKLGPAIRRLLPRLHIAAVSRTAERVAVENGLCQAGETMIVPNPISPDEVLAMDRASDGSLVVGFLGGATERKGFDLLPQVIASMSNDPLRWRLHVLLTPERSMRSTWTALAEFPDQLVDMAGKVLDVREAYARLDIVFCPSRQESFCRVAAEAMLNGIPVVASDIEPLRSLLGDNEAGILFSVGDVGTAAQALSRLASDPQLRSTMGEAGRRRASTFTPESVARQLMELYGDLR